MIKNVYSQLILLDELLSQENGLNYDARHVKISWFVVIPKPALSQNCGLKMICFLKKFSSMNKLL